MMGRVAYSPDGKYILTGDMLAGEGTVCLWDIATGKEIRRISEEMARSIIGYCLLAGRRSLC